MNETWTVVGATVLAAGVSFLTAILASRAEYRAKLHELTQKQHQTVLAQRMSAYQHLWKTLLTYGRNWEMDGGVRDAAWASEFLRELNACNAQWGVFFSEPVYTQFHHYRSTLRRIRDQLNRGEPVRSEDFDRLAAISTGESGRPGLATQMKHDLGSYGSMALRSPPHQFDPIPDVAVQA